MIVKFLKDCRGITHSRPKENGIYKVTIHHATHYSRIALFNINNLEADPKHPWLITKDDFKNWLKEKSMIILQEESDNESYSN